MAVIVSNLQFGVKDPRTRRRKLVFFGGVGAIVVPLYVSRRSDLSLADQLAFAVLAGLVLWPAAYFVTGGRRYGSHRTFGAFFEQIRSDVFPAIKILSVLSAIVCIGVSVGQWYEFSIHGTHLSAAFKWTGGAVAALVLSGDDWQATALLSFRVVLLLLVAAVARRPTGAGLVMGAIAAGLLYLLRNFGKMPNLNDRQ